MIVTPPSRANPAAIRYAAANGPGWSVSATTAESRLVPTTPPIWPAVCCREATSPKLSSGTEPLAITISGGCACPKARPLPIRPTMTSHSMSDRVPNAITASATT